MKGIYTIEERNAAVERNLFLIDQVMDKHRDIIKAARMDKGDVYQQLAERLVKAADAYEPKKGELEGYLEIQLEREMFSCAHPRRLYGLTDAPTTFRRNRVVSLDAMNEDAIKVEELAA